MPVIATSFPFKNPSEELMFLLFQIGQILTSLADSWVCIWMGTDNSGLCHSCHCAVTHAFLPNSFSIRHC